MTKKTSLWQRLKNVFSNAEPTRKLSPNDTQTAFSQAEGKNSAEQMIVDLTQNTTSAQPSTSAENSFNSDSITADDLDVLLASMGYHFSYHPPKLIENEASEEKERPIHHFTMQISDGQVSDGEREWGCLLRFFEKEQLLAVYSIFPFSVPDTHRGEMLAVMAYLNYDLIIGNVEMDIYDGEVRFKTSLDLEVTGLSEMVLSYLLQSNFAVTTKLYDTLAEVVAKATPAVTASEAVDSLLSAQQEKTFYLMTDTIS